MKRTILIALALALVAAACGNSADETTTTTPTTTTTSTTTTTAPAPTTTVDLGPISPINGLPVADETLLDRRVIAVKIDNHWDARPQSGIEFADAVFELRVEGGLTRFMAVFHSSDAEYLGPIRSGRPADSTIIRPLNTVLFISGAQPWVQAGIRDVGVPFYIDVRPGMFRISGRSAPHNLYGNTVELRKFADDRGEPDDPPPSGFWPIGPLPDSAVDATTANVRFSGDFSATWTWDGERWLRTINGGEVSETRDEEGNTEQIWADTLVMIVGRFYTASPAAGQSGTPVPSTDTIGTGRAVIMHGGKAIEGTWSREDATQPFTFQTEDGTPLTVPAGKVWVSIVPDVGSVDWN